MYDVLLSREIWPNSILELRPRNKIYRKDLCIQCVTKSNIVYIMTKSHARILKGPQLFTFLVPMHYIDRIFSTNCSGELLWLWLVLAKTCYLQFLHGTTSHLKTRLKFYVYYPVMTLLVWYWFSQDQLTQSNPFCTSIISFNQIIRAHSDDIIIKNGHCSQRKTYVGWCKCHDEFRVATSL